MWMGVVPSNSQITTLNGGSWVPTPRSHHTSHWAFPWERKERFFISLSHYILGSRRALNPKLSNIQMHIMINLINFYVYRMESKFQILHPTISAFNIYSGSIRECSNEWNPARPQIPLQNVSPAFLSSWMFCSVRCHFKHPGMCTDMLFSSMGCLISQQTPISLSGLNINANSSETSLWSSANCPQGRIAAPFFYAPIALCLDYAGSVCSTGKTHLDLNPSSSLLTMHLNKLFHLVHAHFPYLKRVINRIYIIGLLRGLTENPHKTQSLEHGM